MVWAAVATAGYVLVKAEIKGHGAGRPATLQAELKTAPDGTPKKLTFIQFNWIDLDCVEPTGGPIVVDTFELGFPTAKAQKQGRKYRFSTAVANDTMSGTISRNGKLVTGRAHFEHEEVYDDSGSPLEPGTTCVADLEFRAKSIFVSP